MRAALDDYAPPVDEGRVVVVVGLESYLAVHHSAEKLGASAVRNNTVGRWVAKLTGKISGCPPRQVTNRHSVMLDSKHQLSSSPHQGLADVIAEAITYARLSQDTQVSATADNWRARLLGRFADGMALCDGDLSTSWFMSAAWFRPAGSARARTGPRRAGAGCAGRAWWPWPGRGSPAVRAGSPGARSGR